MVVQQDKEENMRKSLSPKRSQKEKCIMRFQVGKKMRKRSKRLLFSA